MTKQVYAKKVASIEELTMLVLDWNFTIFQSDMYI
jgi:hypothetical protein